MFIAALIMYVIMSFIAGPLWPIQHLTGKAGLVEFIVVAVWILLFIGGMAS